MALRSFGSWKSNDRDGRRVRPGIELGERARVVLDSMHAMEPDDPRGFPKSATTRTDFLRRRTIDVDFPVAVLLPPEGGPRNREERRDGLQASERAGVEPARIDPLAADHAHRSMKQRILLVEDDPKLGRQIVDHLVEAGFDAQWLQTGDEALGHPYRGLALVVLDLMLPGAFGLDVLKRIRSQSDVQVLVLSAKTDAAVKVRALDMGADDYLIKPFWPEELVARVNARLRRPVMQRGGLIEAGDLRIEVDARRVSVANAPVDLTRVEFDLLLALARRPGAAIARSWLCDHVLDPEREGTERTLDVHVSRLRKKLGACGDWISTVWGVGYRLEVPATA
jgi:two-component system response regulator MtrA